MADEPASTGKYIKEPTARYVFNDTLDKPDENGWTTFQLSLEGYDAGTDATDHLVKWVNAKNRSELIAAIDRSGWKLDNTGIDVIGPYGPVDGVDSYAEPGYLLADHEEEPKWGADEGDDKESGCGCGENCDRTAGDPCPLDALKSLAARRDITPDRLEAAGFDPGVNVPMSEVICFYWREDFSRTWSMLAAFGPKTDKLKVIQ